MKKSTKKPLHLGRSAIVGLRLGAFVVGFAAVAALAVFAWQTFQARTGRPGWELTVVPALVLAFYIGCTSQAEHARKKRAEAMRRRREEAMRNAANANGSGASGRDRS